MGLVLDSEQTLLRSTANEFARARLPVAGLRKLRDTADATGLMINSSRAILYAGKDEHFAAAARQAALETRDAINLYR